MSSVSKRRKKLNAKGKLRTKWSEPFRACFQIVTKLTGFLKRSENSLNQHIKLKHPELWEKLKNVENQHQTVFENPVIRERADSGHKSNEIQF